VKRSTKSTPRGKRPLFVYIPEDLYQKLVEVAVNWYGKSHGALSAYVEYVLRQVLEQHTQIHTKNPKGSVRAVYEQVIQKVKEILKTPFKPEEVPEKILNQAIAEVRGSDYRTIEKWKNLFEKSGLIKFIGGYAPNRIVELL
jgi:hypothetical protein